MMLVPRRALKAYPVARRSVSSLCLKSTKMKGIGQQSRLYTTEGLRDGFAKCPAKEKPAERASRGFLGGNLPFGAGKPLNSHNQHVDGFTLPP